MKKYLILFLFLSSFLFSNSQSIDTVIVNNWYTSYYSYSIKAPLYVVYSLYNGGGDCDRKSYKFKSGNIKITANSKDYSKSGFDQGHLVPYEDLAYNCKAAESTFRFYNAIPQTPNLNRGEWKKWEYIIRRISKTDSLLIIAGGSKYKKKIGNNVGVPDICWKLVWSKSKRVVIYALLFKNTDDSGLVSIETINSLEKKTGIEIKHLLK